LLAFAVFIYKREIYLDGCLMGQPFRLCSPTAMTDCSVMTIGKKSMVEVLRQEHACPHLFVAYLQARNIRYGEELVDPLFNSSENRLARILLLLAHFGKKGNPETVIPKVSQETLTEMIGTTRSRVNFFHEQVHADGLRLTKAAKAYNCIVPF